LFLLLPFFDAPLYLILKTLRWEFPLIEYTAITVNCQK